MDTFKSPAGALSIIEDDVLGQAQEIEEMRLDQLSQQAREIDLLRNHNAQLRDKNAKLKILADERKRDSDQLAALKERDLDLSAHAYQLKQDLAAAKKDYSVEKSLSLKLADELQALRNQAREEHNSVVEQYEKIFAEQVKKQTEILEKILSEKEAELCQASTAQLVQTQSIQDLEANLEARQNEIQELRSSLANRAEEMAEIENLHAQISFDAKTISALGKLNSQRQRDLDAANVTLANQQNEIETSANAHISMNAQFSKTAQELAQQKHVNEALEIEKELIFEQYLKLSRELASTQSQVEVANSEIHATKENFVEMQQSFEAELAQAKIAQEQASMEAQIAKEEARSHAAVREQKERYALQLQNEMSKEREQNSLTKRAAIDNARELSFARNQIVNLTRTESDLKAKFERTRQENAALIDDVRARAKQIAELQAVKNQSQDDIFNAKQEIQRLSSSLTDIQHSHQALQDGFNKVVTQNTGLNSQVERLKSELTVSTEQRSALQAQSVQLNDMILSQARKLDEAEQEIARLRDEAKKFASDLQNENSSRIQTQSQNSQINALLFEKENELAEMRTEIRELRQALAQRSENAESINLRLMSLDQAMAQSQDEKNKIEETKIALEKRELQLRSYVSSLNQERVEMQNYSKQLAAELHGMHRLHPLNDYLAMTEHELAKVEMELRQTPTLSSDRPRLQKVVAQLGQQREFLKRTLENSKRQLEARAAALNGVADGGRLKTLPPLPKS